MAYSPCVCVPPLQRARLLATIGMLKHIGECIGPTDFALSVLAAPISAYIGGSKPNWPKSEVMSQNAQVRVTLPFFT